MLKTASARSDVAGARVPFRVANPHVPGDGHAPHEHEWRCRTCGTLLGVERQGRLRLKYKSAQHVVTGPVTAICRRCLDKEAG